jgi:hypothetical protein
MKLDLVLDALNQYGGAEKVPGAVARIVDLGTLGPGHNAIFGVLEALKAQYTSRSRI